MNNTISDHELLTPAEAAAMFGVVPKTVTRWARAGKLQAVKTIGGHRRYKRDELLAILRELDDLTNR